MGEWDRYSIRQDLVSVSKGAGKLSNFPMDTGQIGESFFLMGHYGLDNRPGFEDRKRAYLEQVMPESLVDNGELYIAGYRSYLSNARIWAEWPKTSDPQEFGILPLKEYWVLSVGNASLDPDDCRTLASMEFPGLRGLQIIPSNMLDFQSFTFSDSSAGHGRAGHAYFVPGGTSLRYIIRYGFGVDPAIRHSIDNIIDFDFNFAAHSNSGHFPISGYSSFFDNLDFAPNLCASDRRYTWNLRGSHSRDENCVGKLSEINSDNVDLACNTGNASVVYAFLGDQR